MEKIILNVSNKLEKIPATEAYVDFGTSQTIAINEKFLEWLAQQTFADTEISSEFRFMVFSGLSEDQKYTDHIKWDLKFENKVKIKELSDALLHEHRYPDITTFNSKPQLFDAANYINIRVENGEKGWVKTGKFPANVYISKNYDEPRKIGEEPKDIAVQTDVKREALAGFKAALEWQKFRAMAVACSDFIAAQIKRENKKVKDHNAQEYMRSRREIAYPLFVGLLPDTRITKGATALKPTYKPGTLEGAAALELEHHIDRKFGVREKGDNRPIYYAQGRPIAIVTNPNGYDAVIKFNIKTFSHGSKGTDDEEQVRLTLENQLKKHFAVELKSYHQMEFSFALKNAHEIEGAIRDGATDTQLHRQISDFGEALRHTQETLKFWYGTQIHALKERYASMLNEQREYHFSLLEGKLGSE